MCRCAQMGCGGAAGGPWLCRCAQLGSGGAAGGPWSRRCAQPWAPLPLQALPGGTVGGPWLCRCVAVLLALRAGESDINPAPTEVSQALFATMSHSVPGNLVAGAIAEAGAIQAGDMMQVWWQPGLGQPITPPPHPTPSPHPLTSPHALSRLRASRPLAAPCCPQRMCAPYARRIRLSVPSLRFDRVPPPPLPHHTRTHTTLTYTHHHHPSPVHPARMLLSATLTHAVHSPPHVHHPHHIAYLFLW